MYISIVQNYSSEENITFKIGHLSVNTFQRKYKLEWFGHVFNVFCFLFIRTVSIV